MNLSGLAVRAIAYYNIPMDDFIVIYDDLDMEVGKLLAFVSAFSGGHNGIKSIIAETGTQEFDRIKIPVLAAHRKGMIWSLIMSLEKFSEDDYANNFTDSLDKVGDSLQSLPENQCDFEDTMRRYNV